MAVKNKKSAFTLVEMLAVIAIIAILVAILIPALTMVRNMAKETKQKVQLTTIEMALTAFKDDYGDYPPSERTPDQLNGDYLGAQKLAEAIFGWDLMGFHPDSAWRADGADRNGGNDAYDPPTPDVNNLKQRRGPYLELATASVFRLRDLFGSSPGALEPDTYVICDVFGRKPVTIGGKTVKAGAPILYYKANTASKTISTGASADRIYNFRDNDELVFVKETADQANYPGLSTPINPLSGGMSFFYGYIRDPKIPASAPPWPYRPDSYLLISAGVDGFYGTSDDICNF